MEITKAEVVANNYFINETDRVILFGELAELIVQGHIDFAYAEGKDQFLTEFEVDEHFYLADEEESFNDYLEQMHTIVRKVDGKRFGFQHWADNINSDVQFDSNGSKEGVEVATEGWTDEEWSSYPTPFVFYPVQPFTITGFKFLNK